MKTSVESEGFGVKSRRTLDERWSRWNNSIGMERTETFLHQDCLPLAAGVIWNLSQTPAQPWLGQFHWNYIDGLQETLVRSVGA